MRGIGNTGKKLNLHLEQELRPFSFSDINDLILSAMPNVDDCYLCHGMPDHSVLGTRFQLFCIDSNLFDSLFDAVLVSPPWAALVPMTLLEDCIGKLMQYIRAVHLSYMACPVMLCSENHGPNAS